MRQDRWRKAMEWPLAAVAVVFLLAYTWQVLGNLQGSLLDVSERIIWITWAVFLIDYIVNLALANNRGRWFITHLFDFAVVLLPLLRPLRLLRLITLLNVLQRTASSALRGRVILYAATASVLLVYVAALAMLDAERGHGGEIQTFQAALWWAFVSITTVGYGDYFPVTPLGQMVAVGVMVGGIALIGIVTATLASWIVDRVAAESAPVRDASEEQRKQLDLLVQEVRTLRHELAASRGPDSS